MYPPLIPILLLVMMLCIRLLNGSWISARSVRIAAIACLVIVSINFGHKIFFDPS